MSNEAVKKPRRDKGDGTIFQNKQGRWIARISRKGMTPKEFSGKTKTEVKAKLEEYKMLAMKGEVINKSLTVEEYGKKFLYYKYQQVVRKTLKSTTYDRLEQVFENQIRPYPLAKMLMCNLTTMDIQTRIDAMMDEYSLSSIKKTYLFIHSMIKFGIEQKDLPKDFDPCKGVELPSEDAVKVKTKTIEIIPDDELELVVKTALSYKEDGTLEYRYGPLLVFGAYTGLRLGEMLALSRNNIITDRNGRRSIKVTEGVSSIKNRGNSSNKHYIHNVTTPKYPNSKRTVPLNKTAETALDIMLETYGEHLIRSDLIVCTSTGQFPTKQNIEQTLNKVTKRNGLQHYGVHALRHTFATRILTKVSSHQDIKAIAELLGDDYKVVVKTYLHTDDTEKQSLVDLL